MNNFELDSFIEIDNNCKTKKYYDRYKVGDIKTIELKTGDKIDLVILDKNVQNEQSLVIGMKDCFDITYKMSKSKHSTWQNSDFRLEDLISLIQLFPDDLQNVIKDVVKCTIVRGKKIFTVDKYWLLSYRELTGHGLSEGEQYKYFKDNTPCKYMANSGITVGYITRTLSNEKRTEHNFMYVTKDGKFDTVPPDRNVFVSLCFCI